MNKGKREKAKGENNLVQRGKSLCLSLSANSKQLISYRRVFVDSWLNI